MSCEFGSVKCCRLYGTVLDCVDEENVGILKGQGPDPVIRSRSKLMMESVYRFLGMPIRSEQSARDFTCRVYASPIGVNT